MYFRLIAGLLLATLLAGVAMGGTETNGWPFYVRQERNSRDPASVQMLGPLYFETSIAEGTLEGFRPLFLTAEAGELKTTTFLYPLFVWQVRDDDRTFSFFQLLNHRRQTGDNGEEKRNFDVWPFYFSRQHGDPAGDYRAFFPLGGTIKHRLGNDRIQFVLFPLYVHSENDGRHIIRAPWPFLRFIHGGGHRGFEFWPLFGHQERAGDYDRRFALWPLYYRSVQGLGTEQPDLKVGFLPFYTKESGPGLQSETYLWPFFGYTHRTKPEKYDERRYFWPFLVQGHGDRRKVNRWGPLYTHSVIKGYDKTWLLWPLFRHAEWAEDGVAQEKNQLLFFIYWSQTQRSLANPEAEPAYKSHLWPLLSVWDNGAGRRQLQFLSPLEVFFPRNDPVRQLYTPLFALYRYDRRDAQTSRHSLLWNAISYRRSAEAREFHLGPLFSYDASAGGRRVAVGHGVLGFQRAPGVGGWRFFLFDFPRKSASKAPGATPP